MCSKPMDLYTRQRSTKANYFVVDVTVFKNHYFLKENKEMPFLSMSWDVFFFLRRTKSVHTTGTVHLSFDFSLQVIEFNGQLSSVPQAYLTLKIFSCASSYLSFQTPNYMGNNKHEPQVKALLNKMLNAAVHRTAVYLLDSGKLFITADFLKCSFFFFIWKHFCM